MQDIASTYKPSYSVVIIDIYKKEVTLIEWLLYQTKTTTITFVKIDIYIYTTAY